MIKMKQGVFLVLLLSFTSACIAQTKKVFHSWGYTIGLETLRGESTLNDLNEYYSFSEPDPTYLYWEGRSILSILYKVRYNLTEINDDLAVSSSLSPTLGLSSFTVQRLYSFDDQATGHLTIPFHVNLEMGHGATINSLSNVGFTVGAGYELNLFPILGANPKEDLGNDVDVKNNSIIPSFTCALRFISKKSRSFELRYKLGYGGKTPTYDSSYQGLIYERINSHQFSLNYNYIY